MPHIHTGPHQHDLMVSAYIIKRGAGSDKLLLHKHRTLGRYMQFGGHVELHENPWQALLREIREESGYESNQLQLLQPPYAYLERLSTVDMHPHPVSILTYPSPNDHYHTDICYAFITDESPRHPIAEGESEDFYELDYAGFMSLSANELFGNVREVGDYILSVAIKSWKPVNI